MLQQLWDGASLQNLNVPATASIEQWYINGNENCKQNYVFQIFNSAIISRHENLRETETVKGVSISLSGHGILLVKLVT